MAEARGYTATRPRLLMAATNKANLAAMCEGCNLGLRHGPRRVNPRTYAIILWRLVLAELRHST